MSLSDEALHDSIAAGGPGRFGPHAHTARELLRLPTVELRRRAEAEGQTLTNIVGGVPSGNVYAAVNELLRNIERGEPDAELYGERFAREAREAEAELRRVTGNPSAIHIPRGLR